MRVTVGLCNGSFVRWCNGFCPRLITRMFRDRACVRRRLPLPIIRAPDQHSSIRRPERHVRCWQSSTQSISDARKGHCLFLAEFDHDSRVLLEPDTAKMLGLCDDLFRSRGRPKALCAVRLGVRGAKRCAGQLGGRARVQRGGDLSRHLPPRPPSPCRRRYYQKMESPECATCSTTPAGEYSPSGSSPLATQA